MNYAETVQKDGIQIVSNPFEIRNLRRDVSFQTTGVASNKKRRADVATYFQDFCHGGPQVTYVEEVLPIISHTHRLKLFPEYDEEVFP